jgi:hypothetical protein
MEATHRKDFFETGSSYSNNNLSSAGPLTAMIETIILREKDRYPPPQLNSGSYQEDGNQKA